MLERIVKTTAAIGLAFLMSACDGSPTKPASVTEKATGVTSIGTTDPTNSTPPTVQPTPEPEEKIVFSGAGDIASAQNLDNARKTAELLRQTNSDFYFGLGDYAYDNGYEQEYLNQWIPTWGFTNSRMYPAQGNHEKDPYYWGVFPNSNRPGYYSYDLGQSWHIIVLNSTIEARRGSAQYAWLEQELRMNNTRPCTIAYFHHPPISSGSNGDNPHMNDSWRALVASKTELVIAAHDHLYERFRRMNADYKQDPEGTQLIIAGTGGHFQLYNFQSIKSTSEFRQNQYYGILKLTLKKGKYSFEHITTAGTLDQSLEDETCRP